MNPQQKRTILLLKDNIDKIITNGIKPNLLKLEKSSRIIKKSGENRLSTECMTARLTIQQLRSNLTELEKCYLNLKQYKIEPDYETMIMSIKKDVLREIENFIKTNGEIDFNTDWQDAAEPDQSPGEDNRDHRLLIQKDIQRSSKAEQNLRDVQTINHDLNDLHDLMGKFGTLVHEQHDTVNHIEENVDNATNAIHQGTRSLATAASTSVVPIACAAAGAMIFGPIGALVSFKISTGIVSAIGGSAISFSLASYVKNKRNHQNQIELDDLSTTNNID